MYEVQYIVNSKILESYSYQDKALAYYVKKKLKNTGRYIVGKLKVKDKTIKKQKPCLK